MDEISVFKSAICEEIDGAIQFRSGTAERFPDDERNQRCVDSLTALASNLAKVPEDDETLRRCFKAYKWKHQRAGNVDAGNAGYAWLEDAYLWFPADDFEPADKSIFSRYGFDAPMSGDATGFLSELSSEIDDWDVEQLKPADY